MKIIIDYEASWRNSFLDGSNDEPVPKNKKGKFERDFVASMKQLGESKNYIERKVTKNTVMGVLSRLIGDQRKLYQARNSNHYYFSDMEDAITFIDKPKVINNEMVYIRNMKGSTDQRSFTGMIKVNDPIFQSDYYSAEFWGVLALDFDDLQDCILNDAFLVDKRIDLDPVSILNRLEAIKKIKPVEYADRIKQASDKLATAFEKYKPLNKKEQQLILPMYCSALYLQMARLEKKYNILMPKAPRGGINGISNNGFTPKNFMDAYVTGGQKLVYGNAYAKEERSFGKKTIKPLLTKASGQLEINLDIDLAKAKELKNMIECAGVSSFYLGKKGLAYVSSISAR